jgi:dTDP-L-rhamnose 4-epimerase
MRVLVTGGAGFIGSHIVEALLTDGHEVRVLDTAPAEVAPEVEVFSGDIRDRELLERAIDGVDAVSHQAALIGVGADVDDAVDFVAYNDFGTAVLLGVMARAGIRRLVLGGSISIYGEGHYECPTHGLVTPGPRLPTNLRAGRFEPVCPQCGEEVFGGLVDETATPDPRNLYAASKLAQEHLSTAFARTTGARVAALRYHHVYGPRMPRDTPYAGIANNFRSALAAGLQPKVFEDGAQRRDFVHARDVASANLAALDAITHEGPITAGSLRAYNVGSGTVRTIGELAHALSRACDGPAPVITGGYRIGDVRHITASSLRIRSELGWSPREDFEAGMAEFMASDAEHYLRVARPTE